MNKSACEEAAAATLRFYEEHLTQICDAHDLYLHSKTPQGNALHRELSPDRIVSELEASDLLLVTATDMETRTLWGWLDRNAEGIGNDALLRAYDSTLVYTMFRWHGHRLAHVSLSHTGSDMPGGSSDVMREVLRRYTPRLVATLGVAFGRDWNAQEIGDVLVARRWVAYDRGIKWRDGKPVPKDLPTFSIARWLDNRLRSLGTFLHDGHTHYGTMITGEAVVDDDDFKRSVMAITREYLHESEQPIGGEMEAFGLCSECERAQIPLLMMKGVCDWASGKNDLSTDPVENDLIKDRIQSYAMCNAIERLDVLAQSPYLLAVGDSEAGRDQRAAVPVTAARTVFNSYGDGAIQAGSIGSITLVNR